MAFKHRRRSFKRRRLPMRRVRRFARKFKKRSAPHIKILKLRNPSLMPDALFTKMKFQESIIFTDAGGGDSSEAYRMNDIFNVRTGANTRPLGFDELATFYARWEVLGAKIVARVVNQGNTEVNCLLVPSSDAANEALDTAKTYPYAQYKPLGFPTGGKPITYMKQYMSIRKFEGRRTTDVNYTGTISASPTNVRFWQLGFNAIDGVTEYTVSVEVKVFFYVRWYTRNPLGPSNVA